MEDKKLTYGERWKLAYNEEFYDWLDKNEAKGIYIIPSCSLESVWDEMGVPKLESEIGAYLKKNNFLEMNVGGVICTAK